MFYFTLTLSIIKTILKSKAWHPDRVSVWCSAFEDEDLQVLEYHEELKYWYQSIFELNTKQDLVINNLHNHAGLAMLTVSNMLDRKIGKTLSLTKDTVTPFT